MKSIRRCAPLLLALAFFVAAVISSPIPEGNEPEPVRETLETLSLETPSHDDSQRDKRTIGFLRTLFPGLSEIIDRKIQSLTRLIFRLVGRLVLGGGGGDSRSSSSSDSSGGSRRISITLPTFPPSLEDEEEESQTEQDSTSEPSVEDNLAGSESRVNEVRVPYDGGAELDEEDQEAAATGDEGSPVVARSDDDTDSDNIAAASDSGEREKRFLFFGGGDSSAGSAGGSGNFLFDIIRSAADTSARTVGRLYRVIAGTDLSAASNSTIVVRSGAQKSTTLITGSGSSDAAPDAGGDGKAAGDGADAAAGGGADGAGGGAAAGAVAGTPTLDPNEGYTSGIPGPLTRLFIIANRGISNLLQDLILRLSQTSERIVNFKARLITALI